MSNFNTNISEKKWQILKTHIYDSLIIMIHTHLTSYSNVVKDMADWSYRAMRKGQEVEESWAEPVREERVCRSAPGPQYRADVVYTTDTRSLYFLSNKLHSASHLPTGLFAYCFAHYFVPAHGVAPSTGIMSFTGSLLVWTY